MKKASFYVKLTAILAIVTVSVTVMVAMVTLAGETEMDPNYEPAPIIESGDYGYQENEDGTITIAEYYGSEEDIEIPTELDGYPVSAIGYQAFSYQKMKSLTIPEEIGKIGMRAFEYCTVSENLTLPNNIEIQKDAFGYAKLPEVVTIPEGAVLKNSSFSYLSITKLVIIESGAVVEQDAFSYAKALENAICATDVILENEAFDSSHNLTEVVLCGDVQTSEDSFHACDNAEIRLAEADEFEVLIVELQAKAAETAGLIKYTDGKMTFFLPRGMIRSYSPDFDFTLVNSEDTFMLGTVEYSEPSILDFTKDEDIQTMVDTAKDYVAVDSAYKVTVCGYPAVWINIHDTEETNVGVYLYFSSPTNMYYLMYVNIENSYQEFIDLVNSIAIDGKKEDTDLSAIIE